MEYQQAYMEKMRLKVVLMMLPFYSKFYDISYENFDIDLDSLTHNFLQ